MSAIEQLIDHCHEQYPHLESARGQADILAAQNEADAQALHIQELESIVRSMAAHLEAILNIAERNHPDLEVLKQIRPHAEAFNVLEAIDWMSK
jgi:hypothetical protein